MDLVVLGCDGSWAGPGGAGSGYLVTDGDTRVVFDLGGGALGRLQEHVSIADLNAVFLSHEHADHFADIYPLSIARYYGRLGDGRLPVHVAPGMAALLAGILVEGTREAFDAFDLKEVAAGDEVRVGDLSVRAFAMRHSGASLGYRVEGAGVLAYSGDTGPVPDAVELARRADVFLCEATWEEQRDMPIHLTPGEAGRIAAEAGVGKLVLTHLEPGSDAERWAEAASERFAGPVELARPGLRVSF